MGGKESNKPEVEGCSGCKSAEHEQGIHNSGGSGNSKCPASSTGRQEAWKHDTAATDGLDTRGLASSIPKGGEEEQNWVYPSPQRFFNAMKKKGWNPNKEDVNSVVSIHNTVNERCWQHILEYESFHRHQCTQPKLLRFRGRPKDLSPKARLYSLLGYSPPFDRHDWVVDRCGTEVRYVIDFYKGKQEENTGIPVSIYLDVRPELSMGGLVDRTRMYFSKTFFSK